MAFKGYQLTDADTNGFTLNGTFKVGSHSIRLGDTLVDATWAGFTELGTAGAALAFGDLIYLASADSKWELSDADESATYDKKVAICLTDAAEDAAVEVLLWGKVRCDSLFPTMTPGAQQYMSGTAGDITGVAPANVRPIGFANTADELFFCPSPFDVAATGFLTNIVEDLTPQLGGNLDANGFSIILPSTSTAGIALYNTADQVTNYEKGVINWASNVFKISTSEGGSGTARALTLEVPRSGAPAIVTTYTLQRENAIPFHQLSWTATTTANNVGVDIGGSIGGEATKALNVSTAFTSDSATAVTGISIAPTVAQSGTAGYYGLSINPTETTVGSGVKRLISAQVSSVDKFTVSNDGHTAISGVAVGPMLTVTSSATAYTNGGGTVELGRTGNLSMVNGESFNSVKILPAFTVAAPATGSAQFNGLVIDLSGVTHDVSAGGAMNSSGLKIVGGASTSGSFNYGLEVSAASSIFTGTSGSRSALSVVNNSLTTSYGLSVTSSSSSLTSGSVLRTSKTGTSGTTAFTGSVADVSWTHNHNAAATLDHTANALDVSRAITSNHASAAITVSGALADLNSTNVQTLGTLTDTGNILKLTQGYASASGDVISIANSGTGKDISGTGSTWSVSKIGAAVLTALTVNSVTVIDTSGNLSSANGVASFTGSPSSITVTNGIVTAIS
ncbi:MAG: hypothetical protein M0R37_14625 [Bacteroidales bacterium]|nr:hypothetical protein [Bacteroidales bacterium]